MALTRLHVAADCGFWPAAAQAVLEFARDHGAQERQLGALTWVVPSGALAQCARAALHEASGRRALILPRVVPLVTWLGDREDSGIEARVEIFSALRSNEWIARSFGEQSETLWSLASDVARICDELTLAAVDQPEALEERLQTSLARHFGRRASRVLQAPAQLVLRLWRARREAGDGAARMIAALAVRATALQGPLVYLGGAIATAEATAVEPWERAFVERAAARSEVLHLVPDVAMALTTAPMLGAAWPELIASGESAPIAARAQALLGRASVPPVVLTCGASLEETASVVAQQTLRWLGEGRATIALVALDRLLARRVRALLERAEVLVRDETGWKLSTTSAAASIMRWLDLVRDDFYWRDLLDWLKSSFTLADRAGKAHEVAVIERAIRSSGVVQGAQAIRRALTEAAQHDDTMLDRAAYDRPTYDRALEVLRLVEAEVQATRRATNTLSGQLRALRHAMTALGMQTGLDADPVGRTVLAELDRLDHQLASQRAAATFADFRALLALRFEEAAYVDTAVESPVAMVTLASAALRDFDAVALVGADASHLPSATSELLFMSNAVRAELGLATAERSRMEESARLAVLLARTPFTLAAWRARIGDEPNPVSPLLERLQFVSRQATGDDLVREPQWLDYGVSPVPATLPRPVAPQLLPPRVTAGDAQSLVDCPYQFYARRMLGLDEPDDVIELPDKRDFGIALHEVLKRFHRSWGGADFSALGAAELVTSLREHARAVFAPQLARAPGMLAYQRRFDGLVAGYVAWLQQHAAAGWRWTAGEESHRASVALRDGRNVELAGRIDRVDARPGGATVLIDYKARDPVVLRRALGRRGEEIQLPFYGLLLPRPPDEAQYLCFDRARDRRGGVESVAPDEALGPLTEAIGVRLREDLQRIADGAPLPAIGCETVCGRCEMRGLCRRDHWAQEDDRGAET